MSDKTDENEKPKPIEPNVKTTDNDVEEIGQDREKVVLEGNTPVVDPGDARPVRVTL